MIDPVVVGVRCEYGNRVVGVARPRLTWATVTDAPDWMQDAYEIEVDGVSHGWIEDSDSVFRSWPSSPMESRQVRSVRVRVRGTDGVVSPWSDACIIEAALLDEDDWSAEWITSSEGCSIDESSPAIHLRRSFEQPRRDGAVLDRARLHVTSAGVHSVEMNGRVVGDHVMAPGWSSYPHRIHYDTHDVTEALIDGSNVIGIVVADGWWRGHLGFDGRRNIYGHVIGALVQLELIWSDGHIDRIVSDGSWRTSTGAILASDIYEGETVDARRSIDGWSTHSFDDAEWSYAIGFSPEVGSLVVPTTPPVRRVEEREVRELLTSPSGATILDFGQNIVGRVRFTVEGPAGTKITLRHAEVLEGGELAVEPLRAATSIDRYILRGGGPETWEPQFTFHGFRYVEVVGWPGELDPSAFRGIVIHSDMERTGTFECSDPLLDRFHENVVWGMRGNFLSVPTDCPQRDERLGWTGDLQIFAPVATFLYDVGGFLADWLDDLRADQALDGTVPSVIPVVPGLMLPPAGAAAWADAATVVPMELLDRYGDVELVERQFESMCAWVDRVADRAGPRRIWNKDFQFGDWLDPTAPNERPWQGRTDPSIVATAYFARSAQLVADAAGVIGRGTERSRYLELAAEVRAAFRDEFLTPAGRMMSDSATAYALALAFDLVEEGAARDRCASNLRRIVRENFHTITTGFVGTPLILPSLTASGHLDDAYELMMQRECPSWLYAVAMGATTIWERWDSMLPDGSVNGSGMTSFNHYALGSAAQWLHETVGGLSSDDPGMRRLVIDPQPGGGLSWATTTLRSAYGEIRVRWELVDGGIVLDVDVPSNCSARVHIPGTDEIHDVGSGSHHWSRVIVRGGDHG